jgi:2-polyprenyl-6-methoxyphenol hydroxylase-like FAD-dependent oxidoreductase
LRPRAIIAGAGIGGLAAAMALSQAGFKISIYERTDKLEEFGAGLQITPNATRVLARLGLLERVRQLSSKPSAVLVLRGSDNAKLMRLPLDDAERRWGAEYLVIHRADLQTALVEAVRAQPGVELSLGTTVTGFATAGDAISVDLQRRGAVARDKADLLVGADGLHSQMRNALGFGGPDQANFTGCVAYRALVNAKETDPQWARSEIVLRLGPEAHLVQYPLRRRSIINFVATVSSLSQAGGAHRQFDGAADLSTLERAFAGWSKEARALTSAPVEWRTWPLYCRPPIPSFSLGRAALVGDAAHPMVPFLAQGAAQAIEDAGVLARVVTQTHSIPAALAAYSRERVGRAARVQREALRQGRIYHLGGALAFARDMTMRMLGPRRLGEHYDWLYGA